MNLRLENISLPARAFRFEVSALLTNRVTAIFGASGSGKTTLLELIAGLRKPATGSIALDGCVLEDTGTGLHVKPEYRKTGYVPQEGALFPHMTAAENLRFGHAQRPGARSPEIQFDHVVEILGLEALLDRRPFGLSGGERQRVALGRALLANPRLLLLDEPLAGLDSALKQRLLSYLIRVRDGFRIPILYVTHSADEAVALCEDVLVLEAGRAVRHAPVADAFAPTGRQQYGLTPTED